MPEAPPQEKQLLSLLAFGIALAEVVRLSLPQNFRVNNEV